MGDKNDKARLRDGQYTYTAKKDLNHIWTDKEKTEIINKVELAIMDSLDTPILSLITSNQSL